MNLVPAPQIRGQRQVSDGSRSSEPQANMDTEEAAEALSSMTEQPTAEDTEATGEGRTNGPAPAHSEDPNSPGNEGPPSEAPLLDLNEQAGSYVDPGLFGISASYPTDPLHTIYPSTLMAPAPLLPYSMNIIPLATPAIIANTGYHLCLIPSCFANARVVDPSMSLDPQTALLLSGWGATASEDDDSSSEDESYEERKRRKHRRRRRRERRRAKRQRLAKRANSATKEEAVTNTKVDSIPRNPPGTE